VFVERIGLAPKHYARIARLQRVLARMRGVPRDRIVWSRIASEHGFFDQSHLVNEFRALTSVTPATFGVVPPAALSAGIHLCG
jgi:methylphosphotriester-DNA--protein-cysteine methyltransferase